MSKKAKGAGLRFNKGKLQHHQYPEEALEGLARGFMAGEHKGYPKFNYRLGMSPLEVSDSLRRHLYSWLKGIDVDEETGINHLDLILTNAAILQYTMIHFKHLDDRFKGRPNVKAKVCKVSRKRRTPKTRK